MRSKHISAGGRFSVLKRVVQRFRKLDRNIKLGIILILILLLVGLATAVASSDKQSSPSTTTESTSQETESDDTPSIQANVSYIQGIVEERDESGNWKTTTMDAVIKPGMGLRTTGASSRAAVTFEDGSIIRLDANSEVTFDRLTASRITIEQESGYVYNRVTQSSSRLFQIVTESAQFEALGTAFRTTASGDEEAVEVFQSSVRETINNRSAKEGQKMVVKSNVNPSLDGQIEQIDIEKLKQDEFITWNREQDRQNQAFKSQLGFLADFDGPKIESIEPASGSSIDVEAGNNVGSVTIKGKTEKGTKLTIQSKSISGSSPVEVTVNDDGSFDSGILTGAIGTSVFELIAKDKVGNTTKQSISYLFKRTASVQQQSIILGINSEDSSKVTLNWSLSGVSTPDGVKILVSEGTKTELTLSDAVDSVPSSSTTWEKSVPNGTFVKGKTYSIAVCRYLSSTDTCDITSNIVTFKVPK